MHRPAAHLSLILSLVACGEASPSSEPAGAQSASLPSFAPAHLGIETLTGRLITFSVSSFDGLRACGLVDQFESSPGRGGENVFARFYTSGCTTDVYSLRSVEHCRDHMRLYGDVDDGCAVYRGWDAQGQQEFMRYVTGGVLYVERDGVECRYVLELSLPNGEDFEQEIWIHEDWTGTYCTE